MAGTDLISAHGGDDPETGTRGPNELRALSALAFEELRGFPAGIRDMHLGIAQRAFRGVGPAGRPVQVIHDALSRRAYGAIASGAALFGTGRRRNYGEAGDRGGGPALDHAPGERHGRRPQRANR